MCFVNDELCISQKVGLQTHRSRSTLLLNNLIFPEVEEINVTCSNYTIHTLSVLTRVTSALFSSQIEFAFSSSSKAPVIRWRFHCSVSQDSSSRCQFLYVYTKCRGRVFTAAPERTFFGL